MKLQGWVGTKPDRIITGWIADRDALDETLLVQVNVGEWKSTPVRADEYRNHLRMRDFGTARYGYSVHVPITVKLNEGDPIGVEVIDQSGAKLGKPSYKGKITADFFQAVNAQHLEAEQRDGGAHEALKIVANGAIPARKSLESLSQLVPFGQQILQQPKLAELLRDTGRAMAKTGDMDGALRLLNASRFLNPDDNETIFQLAMANSRHGQIAQSLEDFRKLYLSKWRPARVLSEYAQALSRALESNGHHPSPAFVEEFKLIVEARVALTGVNEGVLPPNIARTLSRFGFYELGLQALDQTLDITPDRKDAHIAKARTLIESRRVEEGLEVAKAILIRWPDDEAALHMIRVFRDMRGAVGRTMRLIWLDLLHGAPQLLDEKGNVIAYSGDPCDLKSALLHSEADWVAISLFGSIPTNTALMAAIHAGAAAGCLHPAPGVALWKASALRDLMESGLVNASTLIEDLSPFEPFYLRPTPERKTGTAILISRYGGFRFGGGEHFLHSAAIHYRDMGFRPLILGLREKLPGGVTPEPDIDGLRYSFIEDDPIALRRLLIEENVTFVHAISGTGFLMAEALGDMNIPFVYGVHYFREVLGGATGEVFFDQAGEPIPRADFAYVLSRASSVYANSRYTQKFLETAHGVRCPIVFSVPEDQSA